MKNITFSADDDLIAQARGLAQLRGTTLNEEFRIWIASYIANHSNEARQAQTRNLIDRLTEPTGNTTNLPDTHRYEAINANARAVFNEREQQMLDRLDGKPKTLKPDQ
jgi:hypothetical protein